MLKFVIDEDIPRSTTRILKSNGYEVLDVRDGGLRGKSDEEVFRVAYF
jgi:predicted nuclease of predicted toxin-antitoxin system